MSPFSQLLAETRRRHGLRQIDLAELLGYEQTYLSALEVGAKGPPTAVMDRMLEAGDVVVAEGFVRNETVDGPAIELAMCDVFELRDGLVTKLTSYLMPAPFPGDSYPRVGGEAPALL